MPESFAETSIGNVFTANGMDPVLRWDGETPEFEQAGVPAAATAPTLASSGTGLIVGDYTAYVRFLDRFGNPGNLSPVSTELRTGGSTGNITDATNASPVVITSAAHGLTTGDTVLIEDVGGNTNANGLRLITVVDANSFSITDTDSDPIAGNAAYTGSGTWTKGSEKITYTGVAVPEDPRVTRRQILRNTNGQALVFYVDVDTTDLSGDSFESEKDDTTLSAQTAVALFSPNGRDVAISRYGEPPTDRAVMAHVLGRMFYSGVEPYRQGAVSLTFGSTTVTGVGTEWTASLAGRFLHVSGQNQDYEISSVDTNAQTLTLSESYQGATAPFDEYAIWPADARRFGVQWSEAGFPAAVSPVNAVTLDREENDGEITLLFEMNSRLYVVQEHRTRVLTFMNDPAASAAGGDGAVFPRNYRGCVNDRCAVMTDDMAYLLDRKGIYSFTGNETESVSIAIQDLWESDNDDLALRIRWEHSRNFHACWDWGKKVARWFVCMTNDRYPRHAICMSTKTSRWWVEEYAIPICSSANGRVGSDEVVFVGSAAGRIFVLDSGDLDGVDKNAGTNFGTVTSADKDSLTDSSASFPSTCVGYTVDIIEGRGKGQRRVIHTATATKLSIDLPWQVRPDTTSKYQIGGVQYTWKSGVFRYVQSEQENQRRVELLANSIRTGLATTLKIYHNRNTIPEEMGVDANTEGVKTIDGTADVELDRTRDLRQWRFDVDGSRSEPFAGARFMEVEMTGVRGSESQTVYEMNIDGVER